MPVLIVIAFAILLSVMFAAIQLWQYSDFPNWFTLASGTGFGVMVVWIVYCIEKRSQDHIESKIMRIERILSSNLKLEKNHPKTSQLYLLLSLDEIITLFSEIKKLEKQWKVSKNKEKKTFLKEKIDYIWKNIDECGTNLQNPDHVSDKLYDKQTLDNLKNISTKCETSPAFNSDKNKIDFHDFHNVVKDCKILRLII